MCSSHCLSSEWRPRFYLCLRLRSRLRCLRRFVHSFACTNPPCTLSLSSASHPQGCTQRKSWRPSNANPGQVCMPIRGSSGGLRLGIRSFVARACYLSPHVAVNRRATAHPASAAACIRKVSSPPRSLPQLARATPSASCSTECSLPWYTRSRLPTSQGCSQGEPRLGPSPS